MCRCQLQPSRTSQSSSATNHVLALHRHLRRCSKAYLRRCSRCQYHAATLPRGFANTAIHASSSTLLPPTIPCTQLQSQAGEPFLPPPLPSSTSRNPTALQLHMPAATHNRLSRTVTADWSPSFNVWTALISASLGRSLCEIMNHESSPDPRNERGEEAAMGKILFGQGQVYL